MFLQRSTLLPYAARDCFFSLADGGKFQGGAIRSRDIISVRQRQVLRNRSLLLHLCSARDPLGPARGGSWLRYQKFQDVHPTSSFIGRRQERDT